ncbi:ORF Y [Anaplasma marginale str. St. Maries]|uniref:Uncharacterized protein n=2 Tax=Anaplasma marginale TaxID=770 RepID=Q84H53_ANAMA|nr:unknown [Anaplasma marginale]AAV86925.1 ORF Y [Anaplasma marginale str. St. Maries]
MFNFARRYLAPAMVALIWLFITAGSTNADTISSTNTADDTATKVICDVIVFVQKLGLPIMTGVVLGSGVMAWHTCMACYCNAGCVYSHR